MLKSICLLIAVFSCVSSTFVPNDDVELNCDVRTQLDSGWVCGRIRTAEENVQYASFRGIPYAQQPLGELRFKELQPLDPWNDVLLATEEGSVCPQYDELYGRLARPVGASESCIFTNVHVPLNASDYGSTNGLPIFVYIHGGAFQSGSGDADVYGPEYLVSKGVIVITFNYRLNVFGYLSLNSPKVPGNNGLRDAITLLQWVQRNARAFGGDPDNVTLGGHSAGSVSAHLLSLSKASEGLFKRLILMSGLSNSGLYTTAPLYAATVAQMFLGYVGINSTDVDDIHDQLVQMPLQKIMEANRMVQMQTGVVSFVPVLESAHSGITQIIDDLPANLIKQGRGKDIPMIIGYTSAECESFKHKVEYLDMVQLIKANPVVILPPNITYYVPTNQALELSQTVLDRYFKEEVSVEKYFPYCTDMLFKYPALKVAQWRASLGGAPAYAYQFAFDSGFNIIKNALMLNYENGSAHAEDLTFLFRTNSMLQGDQKSFPPLNRDNLMKDWMTTFVVNFMQCSNPVCDNLSAWPAVDSQQLNYQLLTEPVFMNNNVALSEDLRDMMAFHDNLFLSAGQ